MLILGPLKNDVTEKSVIFEAPPPPPPPFHFFTNI